MSKSNSSSSTTISSSASNNSNTTSLSLDAQELILKAVQEARATCNDRLEFHPIQYAAAIKFDNGHVYTASQRKTLEYGCSVDAITQMASLILTGGDGGGVCGGGSGGGSGSGSGRPKLIVQVDQYGVIHAPFAAARAFLSEYGFGDLVIVEF